MWLILYLTVIRLKYEKCMFYRMASSESVYAENQMIYGKSLRTFAHISAYGCVEEISVAVTCYRIVTLRLMG